MKIIIRVLMVFLLCGYLATVTCSPEDIETTLDEKVYEIPLNPHIEEVLREKEEKRTVRAAMREKAYLEMQNEVKKLVNMEEILGYKKEMRIFQHDLWLLAHLIYAEGGGENFEFQIRVGNVALNRVASDLYPDTLGKVIFQPGQYSCTWLGGFYYKPSETSWRAARWLLEGNRVYPSYVVYQAQFEQGRGTYEFRVNTYFCY